MGDFFDGSGAWYGEWDTITEEAGPAETVVAVTLPNGDIETWDTAEETLLMAEPAEEQEESLVTLEPEPEEQNVPTPTPTQAPTPTPTPATDYNIDDIYRKLNDTNEALLLVVETNKANTAAAREGFTVCGSLLAAILGGLIAYGFLGRIR